jgi:hypothetical protein
VNGVSTDPDRLPGQADCPECGTAGLPVKCGVWCSVCGAWWSLLPAYAGCCVDPYVCDKLPDGTELHRVTRSGMTCGYHVTWWNGAEGEEVAVTADGRWFQRSRGYHVGPWTGFRQGCEGIT